MTKEQTEFYIENQEYVEDVRGYCKKIKSEFYHIINEVGGGTVKIEYFYIGMIPFKPGINGRLIDDNDIIEFECEDIRSEIGSYLPRSREIIEFEKENVFCYEEDELNIKKCEIYYERKKNYPYIHRHGGYGNSSGHELIYSKMKTFRCDNNALFVSNWVEFGPFCIFFVSQLNEADCLKYWELADTKEKMKIHINIF